MGESVPTRNFGQGRERGASISYLEVEQAAIAILLAGDKPSIQSVRKGLGDRGSSQTIHTALKRFWRDLGLRAEGDPAALSRLPIEIAEAVETIWQRALRLAAQSARSDENEARLHLDRLRIANDVREHSLTLREKEMETQARERERSLTEARDQLLGALRSLSKAQEELKLNERRIGALEAQVHGHRAQLQAVLINAAPRHRAKIPTRRRPKPKKTPSRSKAGRQAPKATRPPRRRR